MKTKLTVAQCKALIEGIERQPGLTRGTLCAEDGERCALGAACPADFSFADFWESAYSDVLSVLGLVGTGLGYRVLTLAGWEVVQENDGFRGTSVARREHMLQWLKERLQWAEAAAAREGR